ncbi:hypothetical protein BKA65DRAFT_157187 [Rhexocercosporidium sp. MPI-PUGE-AT-0058]|nr:hypothetical protein BKA65DRAFT_157187 [Rhexocercosporidium sp. MPI-PUGE-AT-0058]
MNSSNTSSAANATATGFPGDEFANNLFSDLAPLLTLFVEQVTKQFLSLSVGWADNFMLAIAPLGILTVVVSSIRVTKDRYMKALVGRARESQAMAEAELLSSTSEEVCELFDGNQIVRVLGAPDTKEFVYRQRANVVGYRSDGMAWGLREAWAEGQLTFAEVDSGNVGKFATALRWTKSFLSPQGFKIWLNNSQEICVEQLEHLNQKTLVDKLLSSAPNIILNVDQAVAPRWELWLFAWIGIIVQLSVLVFGALTTYHWRFEKGGAPIALYGYPCTLAGTLTVSVGLLLCSHVIEGSTDECKLELRNSDPMDDPFRHRILRIQRACIVSEQHFSSYALFNSNTSNFLRTSRLNKKRDYNVVAAVGSSFAIAGFIVQFVGLRALHWSATIMQLGATVFMTAVRSYVRRGLAHDIQWEAIPEGEELGWLTEHVCRAPGLEVLSGSYVPYDDEDEPAPDARASRGT